MPTLNIKNITNSLTVGIWQITEAYEELLEKYIGAGFDANELVDSKNDTRIKQWLAVRLLLAEVYPNVEIKYNSFGKPYLTNGIYLSVSHAGEYAVIALNNKKECGVDIEQISKKVERIKNKFLSADELANTNDLEELTKFWCAKEALYKLYGKKELVFNQQLMVWYKNKPNALSGRIITDEYQEEHDLMAEKIADYLLVYTI